MADEQVQSIKQAVDIVSIIGERVQLAKAGRNYKGLCPFHGEKSPSFFVSPEMQNYKCFGCGVGGDVIAFLEAYEGLSFLETLELLADLAGIELKRRKPSSQEQVKDEIMAVLNLAQEYYHYLLMEHRVGEQARVYLQQRGVPRQLWKDFRLGYAAQSWDGVQKYLVKKKHKPVERLEQAGLVIRSKRGGYYDRFRGRIIFPQFDFAGHVVGFAGRLLDPDASEAKYINSPETTTYHKSTILYGLYQNKRGIREADRVIVVEGEMDVMASVKAKVREVVAVKGTALTEEHVLLLRRLTKNLVLAMDADAAGQKAMLRAIELSEKQGMQLRVIEIIGGKDPDDLVRESPPAWRKLAKNTVSVYQFYMDLAFSQHDSATGHGQKEISRMLAPVFAKIENAVERAFYVKKLAERLDVAERVVTEELLKSQRKLEVAPAAKEPEQTTRSRRERLERYVLSVGLNLGKQWKQQLQRLEAAFFSEGYLQRLVTTVQELMAHHDFVRVGELHDSLPAEQRALFTELYAADEQLVTETQEQLEAVFEKALRDLETMWRQGELRRLTVAMSELPEGDERLDELRQRYLELKKG